MSCKGIMFCRIITSDQDAPQKRPIWAIASRGGVFPIGRFKFGALALILAGLGGYRALFRASFLVRCLVRFELHFGFNRSPVKNMGAAAWIGELVPGQKINLPRGRHLGQLSKQKTGGRSHASAGCSAILRTLHTPAKARRRSVRGSGRRAVAKMPTGKPSTV